MKRLRFLSLLIILLVLVIVFSFVPSAFAKLKATSAFYVWDDSHLHFTNSISNLNLDGNETNVIHELGFDKNFYDPTIDGSKTKEMCDKIAALGDVNHPQHNKWKENCPGPRNTSYAGVMELAVPFEKIEDTGTALAFDYTLEWSLIDCDLNTDQSWDNADLEVNTILNHPPLLKNWDIMTYPTPTVTLPLGDQSDYFKVLAIDVETDCSMGNCSKELVTTIFMDLDINKDDQITSSGDGAPADASGALPSGCICFYAKAFPVSWPTTPPSPLWGGNPQARITAGGGDKTVNFNLLGPTAITLSSFGAQSPAGLQPTIWLAIVLLFSLIAFLLIRSSRSLPN